MTYYFSRLLAFAALFIANGCSEENCGATCLSDVTITIYSDTSVFAEGRYTVEANLDGTRSTSECTFGPKSTCTGAAFIQRVSAGELSVRFNAAPHHVELTVKLEDRTLATASFDPQYGPPNQVCGTGCRNATHAVKAN